MSDMDELHTDYKPNCGVNTHAWEIELSGEEEETYYIFNGSEREVITEMQRIFDDTFDGGITKEGYPPFVPSLVAHCEPHNVTIFFEVKY